MIIPKHESGAVSKSTYSKELRLKSWRCESVALLALAVVNRRIISNGTFLVFKLLNRVTSNYGER